MSTPIRLDPDAAQLLEAMRAANIPRFENLSPQAARALLAELRARAGVAPPSIAECRDLTTPVAAGTVPLRIYRSEKAATPAPCLVYLHGGGWVLGNLDTHDVLCRTLANLSNCVVITIDYRLAPEHKFPAGLDDACAAWRWIAQEAAALGVDRERIAVGGDSAGGNLAAVMAIMARDGALPAFQLQYLFYPALDLTFGYSSQALDMEGLALTGPCMRWFRAHYLTSPEQQTDWRASPFLASSLEGVAPCYLVTAGVDPLCDEGLAYAARLASEGARVSHEHFPGQMHGFFTAAPNSGTTRKALERFALAMQQGLAAPPS